MANMCTFELRVKGARNAALAVAHSMPNLSAVIRARREAGGVTEIILTGACNWSVNYGVSDQWTWPDCDAVLPGLDEAGVAAHAERIYGCSLKSKSRYLHCEIAVHYWSEESGFDSFDLYRDGKCVKRRRIQLDGELAREYDGMLLDNSWINYQSNEAYRLSGCDMRARADLLSDLVCELCRIGEEDRNAHIEGVKPGDKLTAREGVSPEGRRGVEIFTADGLTLGYLLKPSADDNLMLSAGFLPPDRNGVIAEIAGRLDSYDITAESVDSLGF